jgi:hypothetical protein
MRQWVAMKRPSFFLLPALLLALGCGRDETPEADCHGERRVVCHDGVAIHLAGLIPLLGSRAPAEIRACFDRSCDDVTVDATGCTGREGGPPDQWTYCEVAADGTVEIWIARVDGRDYGDGAEHTIAVSVTDRAGEPVLTRVIPVRLTSEATDEQGSAICFQAETTVEP